MTNKVSKERYQELQRELGALEAQRMQIERQISSLKQKIELVEIAEDQDPDKIGFGTICELEILSGGFTDKMIVIISDTLEKTEYAKLSANSPIGRCIFGKTVGYVGNYQVDANKMSVKVIRIM